MEKPDRSAAGNPVPALRAGIRTTYSRYHQTDRDRFPDIEYNTNRANDKPLRESFEEEFYVVRGLDRTTSTIHIPSTNTLALLFTDDHYVPGKKLLNTCQSYATDSRPAAHPEPVPLLLQPARTGSQRWLITGGALLLAGLVILLVFRPRLFSPAPNGLVITRPSPKSTVPQELVVEGWVSNAETVWLAVRHGKGFQYWIQPGVKVQDDGTWFGVIYVGAKTGNNAGMPFQIRAFVNPVNELKNGQIHYAWPEAELSTAVIDVIRK